MPPFSHALRGLAVTRMVVGASLLIAPLSTSSAFWIPASPISSLPIRLAGARDLAIGGLLFYAHRKWLARGTVGPKVLATTDEPLIATTSTSVGRTEILRSAIAMGLVVDVIDLMSCVACFVEESLPLEGSFVFMSGAAVFTALGTWGLVRVGR